MFQATTVAEMVSWVSGLRRALESVRASKRNQRSSPTIENASLEAESDAHGNLLWLEGVLLKQSSKMKSWNKRWIRLHRHLGKGRKLVLDWRKDQRSPAQKCISVEQIVFVSFSVPPPGKFSAGGMFEYDATLTSAEKVTAAKSNWGKLKNSIMKTDQKQQNIFRVIAKDTKLATYLFQAATTEEMVKWVNGLRRAMAEVNKGKGTPSSDKRSPEVSSPRSSVLHAHSRSSSLPSAPCPVTSAKDSP